jgi:hypothetical protein
VRRQTCKHPDKKENNVKPFTLFGTSACHLCELAEALLEAQLGLGRDFAYQKVDISESDELFERYGVRIPVFRDDTGGRELGWPFDSEQLHSFLASSEEGASGPALK